MEKKRLKNRNLTVRVDEKTAQDLKIRAYNRMISVNSWIIQAILERLIREDRVQ
jgi:predicted HicB family RNase H-like nuclease